MNRPEKPLPAWRATETPYSASVGDPLPGAESLRLDRLATDRGSLTLHVNATRASARCPVCDEPSSRVHSRYERAVRDLPWHDLAVTLRVRTRRFFCDRRSCERAIFCERLPEVAAHARKTGRLEEGLLAIALGLGGEASARLVRELGLLASPDTLLRRGRSLYPARRDDLLATTGETPLRAEELPRPAAGSDGAVATAYPLAQQFVGMVRDLDGRHLEEWLGKARSCEVPAMRRFAASLGKDLAAVRAGLTERWSNGPVEGFVHKLKLVKRQGYGRANFDLLRARILAA